jgi:uncharacterized coiled-coil DUF342 family protein
MESNQDNPPSTATQPLHYQHARPSVIVREAKDCKELLDTYLALRSSYNSLVSKHKSSIHTISKLKSELQSCKRRLAGKNGFRPKSAGEYSRMVVKDSANAVQTETTFNDDTQKQLLNRLADAERQLKLLREENDKEHLTHYNQTTVKNNDKQIAQLQLQLEETSTKLNNANVRCEYYQQKIDAQSETVEKLLELFREYKTKHHSIKHRLQSTEAENAELIDQLSELRQQKEFLEGQVSKLYEPSSQTSQEREEILETMREVRRDYDTLHADYCKVVQENSRLMNDRHCSEPVPSEDVEKLRKRLNLVEDELDRTKRLLKLQITINDGLEKDSKEAEVTHRDKITEYQTKIEELSLQSTQQLQRIHLLEDLLTLNMSNESAGLSLSQTNALSLGADENVLDIHVGKASLDTSNNTVHEIESFVVVDFHTFGSMLSAVAKGRNPEYNLIAMFKLNMDRSTLQALADGVQFELYLLKENNATLFAYATTSSQEGLADAIGDKDLTLHAVSDGSPVGTLGITMKLAQPLGLAMLYDDSGVLHCPQIAPAGGNAMIRDAVKITVKTLRLNQAAMCTSQRHQYFVQYDYLGPEMTDVQTQNDDGDVVFHHETTFAIPCQRGHCLDQILSTAFKGFVRFVVFGGSAGEDSKFSVVGEAHVELSELFQKRELSAQVISLQATVIGTICIIGETKASSIC